MMEKEKSCSYEFGPFRLDAAEGTLWRAGEEIRLTPKLFETLLALVVRGGHIVSKDELFREVWRETIVEESSLSQNISLLRKVLGDGGESTKFIETIPKRGYRFVAPVRAIRPADGLKPGYDTGAAAAVERAVGEPAAGRGKPPARFVAAARTLNRRYALLVIIVALLTATAGFHFWAARGTRPPGGVAGGGGVRSLAVIPFKPLGGGINDEALGLGMADAIIIKLGGAKTFTVLPTSSVARFTGPVHDAREIGRQLGVEAVLDGTVQRDGERVRVTATLTDLRDGRMLWSGKFDEPYTDIFTIQDAFSERVSGALEVRFSGGVPPHGFTHDADAYELYVTGLYLWNKRTEESLLKAAAYFSRAVEKDPDYARAYAALGDTYVLIGVYRYGAISAAEARDKAQAAAARALELDPTLPEAHMVAGAVRAYFDKDYGEARRLYRRAIELGPNSASARLRYGLLLIGDAKIDEAIEQLGHARTLDPLSPTVETNLSHCYILAQRPHEALAHARRALDLDQTFWRARVNLGEAYEHLGMLEAAEAEYKELARHETSRAHGEEQLARLYAALGRQREARRLLGRLLEAERAGGGAAPLAVAIARVYIALGDQDEAFAWLRRAAEKGVLRLYELEYNRDMVPLRADPRFATLQHSVRRLRGF